jgi:hypothetical protein
MARTKRRIRNPSGMYATDEQFDAAIDRVFEKHEELLRKLAE